jgi:hypothetical protein
MCCYGASLLSVAIGSQYQYIMLLCHVLVELVRGQLIKSLTGLQGVGTTLGRHIGDGSMQRPLPACAYLWLPRDAANRCFSGGGWSWRRGRGGRSADHTTLSLLRGGACCLHPVCNSRLLLPCRPSLNFHRASPCHRRAVLQLTAVGTTEPAHGEVVGLLHRKESAAVPVPLVETLTQTAPPTPKVGVVAL